VYNCIGINNHRHFFLYLINLTFGVLTYDWISYYCEPLPQPVPPFLPRSVPRQTLTSPTDLSSASSQSSDQCNILSPSLCKIVNADAYTLLLTIWATLQLTWVGMLLFVQFIQVTRGMTTYENMFGIDAHHAAALNSAFTSTGAPLAGTASHPAAPGAAVLPDSAHGRHGHKHKHGGFLKQWGKLLGVDAFIETATGRGAATGAKNKRRKTNPYSQGCLTNCRDFWLDPAPVFGKRETGAAVLAGRPVNWTEVYETPALMDGDPERGRRRGRRGYEAVAGEEV